MTTLETSPEANSDRQRTEGRKRPLIGAQATAVPKNANGSQVLQLGTRLGWVG